jgi:hypothetical protein
MAPAPHATKMRPMAMAMAMPKARSVCGRRGYQSEGQSHDLPIQRVGPILKFGFSFNVPFLRFRSLFSLLPLCLSSLLYFFFSSLVVDRRIFKRQPRARERRREGGKEEGRLSLCPRSAGSREKKAGWAAGAAAGCLPVVGRLRLNIERWLAAQESGPKHFGELSIRT